MSRSSGTRSPSGPRPEPKAANVAPAANAAGNLRSAAPSRSCPKYEPTWRGPWQLASGEGDSRPSLAPAASGADARVTWTPVDGPALQRWWPPTMWSGGEDPSPWTHGPRGEFSGPLSYGEPSKGFGWRSGATDSTRLAR